MTSSSLNVPPSDQPQPPLSPGACAFLASFLEVCAPKLGNVNRKFDQTGLTFIDLGLAAQAIQPVMDLAPKQRIGITVLDSVKQTRQRIQTNANLGIIFLLAPLAKSYFSTDLRGAIQQNLRELNLQDSIDAYEAIRIAEPGGLGEAEEQDISEPPTLAFREIMELAKDRDLIARQYANDFEDVFEFGVPCLQSGLERGYDLETAICLTHLHWLAEHTDSLILRKQGKSAALEVTEVAKDILDKGWPESPVGIKAFDKFDAWLRRPNVKRNPGTSADLTAACLFIALRDGIIGLPIEGG